MLNRFALIFIICFASPAVAHAKMADVVCDDSVRMTTMLTRDLQAERQGLGLRDPETLMELWVTQRTGEWMLVQNYSNGTSCIVAIGEHWEDSVASPA